MNRIRSISMLAWLVAGMVCTWVGVWAVGWLSLTGLPTSQDMLLGVGFLITSVSAGVWMMRLRRDQQAALRYFKRLSHVEPRDLGLEDQPVNLPVLSEANAWRRVAERLQRTAAEHGQRIEQAEHARGVAEAKMQRLRKSNEQLRAILDDLQEPVIAIDAFDELVLTNASARELFCVDVDGLEQQAIESIVQCKTLVEAMLDTRRRKTSTQRSTELEIGIDDQSKWYHVSTRTIPSMAADDTHRHGAVAVLRDVSGHKAAQKRNAEFVSSVSHEMKTPLAGIRAYAELLADGDAEDDAAQEEFLRVILTQTDRLQRLVDNLLNLARIEAGVVNVSKQPCSLNEVLEEAFQVVQPTAEAKQIELTSELSPLYLGALIDRDMILQLAINLLSNAIKYTPQGGAVRFRSRMKDNEVIFEVEDTGVGLSEEDREKVFEKFYRVKKDRKMAQGTGLGLPLAKHIVEDMHAGQIEVQSTLGRGSTFQVSLPSSGQINHSSS